ncbi:putative RNA-binding protein with ribosomal protein S1 domain [Halobacteroides halobius DSM 5150]|uniref:Putative RNA-binding protein with ribosomal protein S1 domain n=1 Tax=Halobacteroides halobius (strain ATCC 35273 / DSM 5150 / MD-1) TaxID=748449 RepID=L0K6Z4_HALHC|nr:S1 RNA-binding domain-containing protein [Halobacteroides halobius]AGB40144.1 putative RNA-binding protein with ribosomal protein S1 domain [Halobacteroides halobius DSM 5150]
MSIEVGNVIQGKVTGITNFGAFVDLGNGETGLVHISEVADTYVKDISNFLEDGERVQVKVISIDGDGKIGLSIRQLSDDKKKEKFKETTPKKSLDDLIDDFMQESSQRQQDLRSNLENKSGGRS